MFYDSWTNSYQKKKATFPKFRFSANLKTDFVPPTLINFFKQIQKFRYNSMKTLFRFWICFLVLRTDSKVLVKGSNQDNERLLKVCPGVNPNMVFGGMIKGNVDELMLDDERQKIDKYFGQVTEMINDIKTLEESIREGVNKRIRNYAVSLPKRDVFLKQYKKELYAKGAKDVKVLDFKLEELDGEPNMQEQIFDQDFQSISDQYLPDHAKNQTYGPQFPGNFAGMMMMYPGMMNQGQQNNNQQKEESNQKSNQDSNQNSNQGESEKESGGGFWDFFKSEKKKEQKESNQQEKQQPQKSVSEVSQSQQNSQKQSQQNNRMDQRNQRSNQSPNNNSQQNFETVQGMKIESPKNQLKQKFETVEDMKIQSQQIQNQMSQRQNQNNAVPQQQQKIQNSQQNNISQKFKQNNESRTQQNQEQDIKQCSLDQNKSQNEVEVVTPEDLQQMQPETNQSSHDFLFQHNAVSKSDIKRSGKEEKDEDNSKNEIITKDGIKVKLSSFRKLKRGVRRKQSPMLKLLSKKMENEYNRFYHRGNDPFQYNL